MDKVPYDKTEHLESLGSKTTKYQYDEPNVNMLETFPNRHPNVDYFVELRSDEFTSLCPKTGQPDFGSIYVKYAPDQLCIESKSFKLYLFAFRNFQSFMESMTSKILLELVLACKPKSMKVVGSYRIRGGVKIDVTTEYSK
jgi:7-cyano-7-deazaguanine reductase